MYKVKAFKKPEDYELLKAWWKHWGHPIAPEDELPNTGFMVYWDCKPLLCGFLVLTNARFCYIETVCASPETAPEDRSDAIIELVKAVERTAKELGFRRILAFPQSDRLMEKTVGAGFTVVYPKAYICTKEIA